jgi:hypothetical protein
LLEKVEDIRIEKDKVEDVIASAPCGKLPIFEFNIDGKNYKTSETMAVGNLKRKYF